MPNVTGVNLVIYGCCGFGHFRWVSVVLAFDDLFSSWWFFLLCDPGDNSIEILCSSRVMVGQTRIYYAYWFLCWPVRF